MKRVTVIAIGLLSLAVGCQQAQTEPTAQPQLVLEQSTTSVTQYDYKAGYPNQYPEQTLDSVIPPSSPNPYLNQNGTQSIQSPIYDNKHNVPFYGGGWYFYSAVTYTPRVIWSGRVSFVVH